MEQVDQVHWDEQRRVLVLAGLTPAVPARTVLRLAKDWDLPAVAVERVSWSKVVEIPAVVQSRRGVGRRMWM